MSLLDANADTLRSTAVNSFRAPPTPKAAAIEPGLFSNFAEGTGRYFMRSMAEAGRAMSMAVAAGPVVADFLIGDDNKGEPLADQYFRFHDETFGSAVDHWTPRPNEVGAAGQVVGSLAGGIVQFMANPALMVGTAQMGTAEDLVRQGVPADAAILAGDVAALSAVAGIKIPVTGNTLTRRIAAGALGNLATNVPEAAIKREIVSAAGMPQVAAQFDPFDARARTVDVLLGAVFGAKAHMDARTEARDAAMLAGPAPSEPTALASAIGRAFTPEQVDALMVVNSARHIEGVALPGRPATEADLTAGVLATRQAMDQIARGETVSVPAAREGAFEPDPVRQQQVAEFEPMVRETLAQFGEPIPRPNMQAPEATPVRPGAAGAEPAQPPRFPGDLTLPTGEFDGATGAPRTASANDLVARAEAEVQTVRATAARFMETAAACLLGGV